MGEIGMQAIKHPLERFSVVLEHMPAICHLERSRCPVRGSASILGRAVTGDHVDTRMVPQPGRERLGRAIRQEIDWLMVFEVDEDRSIDPPFLQRKIINAKHTWGHRRGGFRLADNTQEGIVTHPHAEFAGQPGTGLAAERIGDNLEGTREPERPLGAKWEQIGQSFRKRAASAGRIIAEKASHSEQQVDGVFTDRQIAWRTPIAAMHPQRWLLTRGADGLRSCAMRFDHESHIDYPDNVHGKARKKKWQNR